MIEGLRQRAARRACRAALAARQPRPLPPDPRRRSVLLLLPDDDDALRAVWALVGAFDLADRLLIPVRVGDHLGYAPDRFAGAIRVIGADETDWRRLPTAGARESIWTQRPDIALNLAPASDLGAALIAGACPAAVRVGFHAPDREPFYDLMMQSDLDAQGTVIIAQAVASVGRLLRQLDPPLIPFA